MKALYQSLRVFHREMNEAIPYLILCSETHVIGTVSVGLVCDQHSAPFNNNI